MSKSIKNQDAILQKLKIEQLNPMQLEAIKAINSSPEVILLSPTGTGKTLAFLLPIIAELDPSSEEVQAIIIVPSRELAIQIEQVCREMGTGFKINAVYGGQSFSKDRLNLKHRPAILIGTPGRVAAHLRRDSFAKEDISILILDEFDKSLEIGFKDEMNEIVSYLNYLQKKILTSATQKIEVPEFLGLNDPIKIDYLVDKINDKLEMKIINSPDKDKLNILVRTINHLGDQPGIIFCNFKNSIKRVSDCLTKFDISHGCFHGGMDQADRERTLIKFRNGTHQLLLATDLAARGLDIPEMNFIIHYHLPNRKDEFIHRNGRTARMFKGGTSFIFRWKTEKMPEYMDITPSEKMPSAPAAKPSKWSTLFITGGRKDKISKGDIAGLFFKQANLDKDQLGIIELGQDCAYVAVLSSMADKLVRKLNNRRLKTKKVRIYKL